MTQGFYLPFMLSTLAGLATMLGALPAVFCGRISREKISFATGFSAGAMLCVSLFDLLPQAFSVLASYLPGVVCIVAACLAFAVGMLTSCLLDALLPQPSGAAAENKALFRVGIMAMLSLMLHNLPEGMAVFLGAESSAAMGLSLCLAIALHNIPEGIAVAYPIYASTKSRAKALLLAGASAVAEPVGAFLAWRFFSPYIEERELMLIFCGIAGLMSAVAAFELLPQALLHDRGKYGSWGAVLGILVMLAGVSAAF